MRLSVDGGADSTAAAVSPCASVPWGGLCHRSPWQRARDPPRRCNRPWGCAGRVNTHLGGQHNTEAAAPTSMERPSTLFQSHSLGSSSRVFWGAGWWLKNISSGGTGWVRCRRRHPAAAGDTAAAAIRASARATPAMRMMTRRLCCARRGGRAVCRVSNGWPHGPSGRCGQG